jgi:guanosine-3',5'-bis(diphosphate) 3'-pyrophosphohydrolase
MARKLSVFTIQNCEGIIPMAEKPTAMHGPLGEAIAFAARAHRHHLRKDGETPYVSHVFRVCLVVRDVFGISDPQVLMAAVLHDTIEDTTTDFDDLAEHFGAEVAAWVASLSKDKRLPEDKREAAYCQELADSPWQVQACKLADIFDNLMDSSTMPPARRARTLANARRYIDALHSDLKAQAAGPWRTVAALREEIEQETQ